MFNPEIAIIIPTMNNDSFLVSTVYNIINHYQDNWKVYIIEQNKESTYSIDKKLLYKTIASEFHKPEDRRVEVIKVPHDSGRSYCRNIGVQKAKEKGIPYCIISSDLIKFDQGMRNINDLLKYFKTYDLIGMEVDGEKNSISKFKVSEDNKIETVPVNIKCARCSARKLIIYKCDKVNNLFMAKTDTLVECPWDEKDKLEQNSFFYRYSRKFKVGFTHYFKGRRG